MPRHHPSTVPTCLLLLAAAAGGGFGQPIGAPAGTAPRRFTDETSTAGLDIWQNNDIGGWHGTYVADYDGDGDEDLLMTSHGIGTQDNTGKNALFRNDGDRTFTEVSGAAGLDGGWHGRFTRELHGASWFDYDHDGDLDLYFPNTDSIVSDTAYHGYDEIYRNNGDGTFSNRSAALGLPQIDHGRRGGIAADIDRDGDLDLVFVNAADETHDPVTPYRNVYVNQGAFFTLEYRGMEFVAWSEGITSLDFDRDGDVDFAVANEEGGRLVLWRNDGTGNFTDAASEAITGGNDGTNGSVTAADVDNDGDLDLHSNKGLYRNQGGVLAFAQAIGGGGENMFFADLDNDGFLDLVADALYYWDPASGDYQRHDAGTAIPAATRGGMAFDYDNDGDLDLVFNISDRTSPYLRFYRNHWIEDHGGASGAHWLSVLVRHTSGQLGCPGARITVYAAGTSELLGSREISTAGGFVSGPSHRQHFGLGAHVLVDLEVEWLTGEHETFRGVTVDRLVEVLPGGTIPEPNLIFRDGFESGDLGAWQPR